MLPVLSQLSGRVRAVASGAYRAAVLADSPVGYWRLGESSGTTAADEQATYAGTYSPNSGGSWTGGTLGTAGLLTGDSNTAATFNGSTGYVATSGLDTLFNGASHGTLECWVSRSSSGSLIVCGFGTNVTGRFNILWFTDGNVYWQTWGFPNCALAGTGRHHLAMTYDGTLGTATDRVVGYIDGVAQALTPGGSSNQASLGSSLGPFEIGREPANSRFAAGVIDEVALYTTTLSAARVLAHYNAGV